MSPTSSLSVEHKALFKALLPLSATEMKSFYFSHIAEIQELYLSKIPNLESRKDSRIKEFKNRIQDRSLKVLSSDYLGLELDFLFGDRFEIYLEYYDKLKYSNVRFEFIQEALFYARDKESAIKTISKGLSDRSKYVRVNAVSAAAYSLNKIFLEQLLYIAEHDKGEDIREDAIAAQNSILSKNHHLFLDREPSGRSGRVSFWVNKWDEKCNSPPGLNEHMIAGELVRLRNWVQNISI